MEAIRSFESLEFGEMPKKVNVDESVYARPKRANEIFDCLRTIGDDWQFVPGVDFKKGVSRTNFITRVRSFLLETGLRSEGIGFRFAWQPDDSVIIRSYQMTADEIVVRGEREERRRATAARKKMEAEGTL